MARAVVWTWRHAVVLTAVVIIAIAVVGFVRLENVVDTARQAARTATAAAAENARQNDELRAEAAARTAASCANSVGGREDLRNSLLGIVGLFASSPAAKAISDYVEKQFPPLTCPADSPIIIPVPSVTTTTSP